MFEKGLIIQTRSNALTVMCLIFAVIILFHIYCLRAYIRFVHNPAVYLKVNVTVFLVFAVINMMLAFINKEPYYTYLFLPYKLFMVFGVSKIMSAAIINLVMLFIIMIIPWGTVPEFYEEINE